MEKNINNEETRLFDLIESTEFADLTVKDRLFVEHHISEEDYNLQRRIIKDSSHLFEENIEPKQLDISAVKEEKTLKSIPLYQALLAIAAVFLIFISIWPNPTEINQTPVASTTKTKIEKEYIHDTIIQYVNQVKILKEMVFDTVKELITINNCSFQEPKLLEVSNTLELPDLNKELIATKGSSVKQDGSSHFIIPLVNSR